MKCCSNTLYSGKTVSRTLLLCMNGVLSKRDILSSFFHTSQHIDICCCYKYVKKRVSCLQNLEIYAAARPAHTAFTKGKNSAIYQMWFQVVALFTTIRLKSMFFNFF